MVRGRDVPKARRPSSWCSFSWPNRRVGSGRGLQGSSRVRTSQNPCPLRLHVALSHSNENCLRGLPDVRPLPPPICPPPPFDPICPSLVLSSPFRPPPTFRCALLPTRLLPIPLLSVGTGLSRRALPTFLAPLGSCCPIAPRLGPPDGSPPVLDAVPCSFRTRTRWPSRGGSIRAEENTTIPSIADRTSAAVLHPEEWHASSLGACMWRQASVIGPSTVLGLFEPLFR